MEIQEEGEKYIRNRGKNNIYLLLRDKKEVEVRQINPNRMKNR